MKILTCTRTHHNTAFTLVEVGVVMVLLSIFMLLAASMFSHTFRYYRGEDKEARLKGQAKLSMYRICKRLRNMELLLKPDYWDLLGKPTDRIVFRYTDSNGEINTVSYYLTDNGKLMEYSYPNSYQSGAPTAQISSSGTKTICYDVSLFTISIDDRKLPNLFTIKIRQKSGFELQTRLSPRIAQ